MEGTVGSWKKGTKKKELFYAKQSQQLLGFMQNSQNNFWVFSLTTKISYCLIVFSHFCDFSLEAALADSFIVVFFVRVKKETGKVKKSSLPA